MKTVLCIESGSFGGGSAESLYTHISTLKDSYNFICIFSSKNRFSQKIEDLGVKVYYSMDNFFNISYEKKHSIFSKFYNLLYKVSYLNFLNFHFLVLYFFNRNYFNFIENIIIRKKIDLIHTNNQPNRDFFIFKLAQKHKIEVISHIRTFNTFGFSQKKARFSNEVVKQFVTYSSFLKEEWNKKSLLENKIEVIPNAVIKLNDKQLKEASIKPNILADFTDSINIAIVGRIIPIRGHLFALKVLKDLIEKGVNVKLFIVGDYKGFEDYYKSIEREVNNLNLIGKIIFTGFVSKPHQFIQNIDILFMPHTLEPFGRVLLEAWQLKTPVVLTNVGHIKNIVNDEVTGVIFKQNDVINCVEKIMMLIKNKELSKKIVNNGYLEYINNYTPESYSKKIKKIYERVLDK